MRPCPSPRRPNFDAFRGAPWTRVLLGGCLAAATLATGEGRARADDTIKRPGDHPAYAFEIEPHALFGWAGVYGAGGFGLGGRAAIPIVRNGFVPSINDSVAVSFGVDWVHYESCWWHGSCSADYFDLPVAMQWNFYVAQRWSVFGEPGLLVYFGSFGACGIAPNLCPSPPPSGGVEPAFFVGGRYHLSDTTALTLRIGFPTFSFGVSFFP